MLNIIEHIHQWKLYHNDDKANAIISLYLACKITKNVWLILWIALKYGVTDCHAWTTTYDVVLDFFFV